MARTRWPSDNVLGGGARACNPPGRAERGPPASVVRRSCVQLRLCLKALLNAGTAQASRAGRAPGRQVHAWLRGCWWSALWLAGFFSGGVGEEVIDHAVQQGGELVQLLRGPVRESGLHAAGARLADAVRCCPACGGELDELGAAALPAPRAGGAAGLLPPPPPPGDMPCPRPPPG